MVKPAHISGISDAGQTRVVLFQSGRLVHVPLTGLATIGDIAALTATDGNFIVGNGTTWIAESGDTARTSLGLSTTDPSGFLPGQVIQETVQTRSVTDSTTSDTFTDTGLSASITPLLSDSVVEAMAYIPEARLDLVAGSSAIRVGYFRLNNSTDATAGQPFRFGRNLSAGASASAVPSFAAVTTHMRYTVNSTSSRTFVLQFRAHVATDLQVSTDAASSTISLILREIRQ